MDLFKGTGAVFTYQLKSARAMPGTWLTLALVSAAMNGLPFVLGGFFAANQASLLTFFLFHPLIYLVLAPILAMHSWGETARRETAERLFSLPLSTPALVLGRFFADSLLIALVLAFSLPVVFTVCYLGTPDPGPMLSGYLGSFLLGLAMLAMAHATAAAARSAIGGLTLGFVVLFLILSAGFSNLPLLLGFTQTPAWLQALASFGLTERFGNFVRGIPSLADIFYFGVWMDLGLSLTLLFIARRAERLRRVRLWVPAVLAAALALFILVSSLPGRFDVTADRRHTLSPATEEMLETLEKPLAITVYWSGSRPQIPPALHTYMQRMETVLKNMQALNPDKITLTFRDPARDDKAALAAFEAGIREETLSGGAPLMMGLTMNFGGREFTVPTLDPSREPYVEYDLMSLLVGLQRTKLPSIGLMTGLSGVENSPAGFLGDLGSAYRMTLLDETLPFIDETLDLVLVYGAPFIPEEGLYALDQYLVRGGKVIWFVDPLFFSAPRADLAAPARNASGPWVDHPADVFARWGITYDWERIVANRATALPVQETGAGITTRESWFVLNDKNINRDLPLTSGLNNMLWIDGGGFDFDPNAFKNETGLKATAVIRTPAGAGSFTRTQLEALEGALPVEETAPLALSVLLTGRFPSGFDRIPDDVMTWYQDQAAIDGTGKTANIPTHLKHGSKPSGLLLVADTDFVADRFALSESNMLGRQVLRPANDNLAFVYNALEFMLGDTRLLTLRGKGRTPRPLEKIETMLRESAARMRAEETKLTLELSGVLNRIGELTRRQETQSFNDTELSDDVLAFRRQAIELRRELGNVRRALQRDIERLTRGLLLLNIFFAPVVLGISGMVYFTRRRRRAK